MIWLILGVALWWGAHLFKRFAPERRAAMGEKGKGAVAGALAVSIVLMVIGYKTADGAVYWGRGPALAGINNLLMLVAFYLFAAAGARTTLAQKFRHPQLTGFVVFALAHLLVNGDVPSFVLFGGLGVWALVEMAVINRAEPDWTPPGKPVPRGKEIGVAVTSVIVYIGVALIHGWIGPWPFG